jgi:hypothetical protein
MKQKQHRNNAEPSTYKNEELDVVEAFKTCHTSSKTGLSEQAREAVVSPHFCSHCPFFLVCLYLSLVTHETGRNLTAANSIKPKLLIILMSITFVEYILK